MEDGELVAFEHRVGEDVVVQVAHATDSSREADQSGADTRREEILVGIRSLADASAACRDRSCCPPVARPHSRWSSPRRRRPAAAGIRPRARCSACSRRSSPASACRSTTFPAPPARSAWRDSSRASAAIPDALLVTGLVMVSGVITQRLTGLARRRHADRAPHRRIRSHRRSGRQPVSIAGRSDRRVQEGSRQRLVGRRIGGRHRRSAGAAAGRTDRPAGIERQLHRLLRRRRGAGRGARRTGVGGRQRLCGVRRTDRRRSAARARGVGAVAREPASTRRRCAKPASRSIWPTGGRSWRRPGCRTPSRTR